MMLPHLEAVLCCAVLQVSVIELYDASPRDLSIESIMLGRTQHAERLSSYSAMQLEVLSQSFYLQHTVTGMGVSQTLQGITTKQLLLHTQSSQVRQVGMLLVLTPLLPGLLQLLAALVWRAWWLCSGVKSLALHRLAMDFKQFCSQGRCLVSPSSWCGLALYAHRLPTERCPLSSHGFDSIVCGCAGVCPGQALP